MLLLLLLLLPAFLTTPVTNSSTGRPTTWCRYSPRLLRVMLQKTKRHPQIRSGSASSTHNLLQHCY
jgi:hypothetical protein